VTARVAKYCYVVLSSGWQAAVLSDTECSLNEVAAAALRQFEETTVEKSGLGLILGISGGHLEEEQYIATASILDAIGRHAAAELLRKAAK